MAYHKNDLLFKPYALSPRGRAGRGYVLSLTLLTSRGVPKLGYKYQGRGLRECSEEKRSLLHRVCSLLVNESIKMRAFHAARLFSKKLVPAPIKSVVAHQTAPFYREKVKATLEIKLWQVIPEGYTGCGSMGSGCGIKFSQIRGCVLPDVDSAACFLLHSRRQCHTSLHYRRIISSTLSILLSFAIAKDRKIENDAETATTYRRQHSSHAEGTCPKPRRSSG
jgi:hypothetical protein